jgi:hypothetical protein
VTRTVDPRPLDSNETAILLRVCRELDSPVGEVLAAQVDRAFVSGGLATMLDIDVEAGAQRGDVPDGPLDIRMLYEGGEVLVWVTDGRLSALEHAWWTDDVPSGMPDVALLAVAP